MLSQLNIIPHLSFLVCLSLWASIIAMEVVNDAGITLVGTQCQYNIKLY